MSNNTTPPKEIWITGELNQYFDGIVSSVRFSKIQFASTDIKYLSEESVKEMLSEKDTTIENMAARMQEMANELTKADREIGKLNLMVEQQLAIPIQFYANPVQLEQDKIADELINRVKSEFNLRLAKKDDKTIREIFSEYSKAQNIQWNENIKWLVRHLRFVYEGQKLISTKDMLPDAQCHCLVVAPKSFPKNCQFVVAEFYDDNKIFYSESSDSPMEDVTHWMPLPPFPKENEKPEPWVSDESIEECCESHLSNFKDKDGKVFCWGQTTCPKCGRWFGMTPDK